MILTIVVFILSIITNYVCIVISKCINSNNKIIISSLYEITAGLMVGIVCFEMIPEVLQVGNCGRLILGAVIGILITILIDLIVGTKTSKSMPFLVVIAMSAHNIMEGVSIGSSFAYSQEMGFRILLLNLLHEIPESMIIGIGINKIKNSVKNLMYISLPTAIGTLIGVAVGNISTVYLTYSLAISCGCMLYLSCCSMAVESKKIIISKKCSLFYILGMLLVLILMMV